MHAPAQLLDQCMRPGILHLPLPFKLLATAVSIVTPVWPMTLAPAAIGSHLHRNLRKTSIPVWFSCGLLVIVLSLWHPLIAPCHLPSGFAIY